MSGKRQLSFWLCAASAALMAAMLILYSLTGTSTFTPTLSGKVLAMMGGSIALGIVLCLWAFKCGKYILYLLELWTWLEFLVYEASYISNVLVGIDGNLFGADFILTVALGMLAWVCALVSAIVQRDEWPARRIRKEA